jgi:hypothetical protein
MGQHIVFPLDSCRSKGEANAMKSKKTVQISNEADLKLNYQGVFELIESIDSQRTSKSLRTIVLDYISTQRNALPIDFDVWLYDFSLLFDILDEISILKSSQ